MKVKVTALKKAKKGKVPTFPAIQELVASPYGELDILRDPNDVMEDEFVGTYGLVKVEKVKRTVTVEREEV